MSMLVVLGCCGGRVYCDIVQFIFGDSLSDVGNNNYLTKSLARATLPWYGIDFGNGLPNGRFTNGRTVADIVGDMMGLPRPLAFLDPKLDEDTILTKGVNYASGAGGILNETSMLFVSCYINTSFNNTHGPCCSVPNIRPTLTCMPLSSLCSDRSKYVFWDEYHPTDRANEIIAIEISNKLGFKPINSSDTTQSPPSPSISIPFFPFSPPSNSAPSPQ